jgi:quinol monooxygenase YgiN
VKTTLSEMPRRDFVAALATALTVVGNASWAATQPNGDMYGEIGKIIAATGKREEVIENILNAVSDMPGCISYIVAKDVSNGDVIWISEVWDNKASHDASLSLPSVKAAIAKNLPLIAGFGDSVVTTPVGGAGLSSPKHH